MRIKWAASSEFVSSSTPSSQILTAHAQPFTGARDLAFCLKVPLDSLLVWASSGGFGETARMRRLAWTFAARIGDKDQIRLTRPKSSWKNFSSLLWLLLKPPLDKTNKMTCAPSEDSDQPGHLPSLIRVFACTQWVAKDPKFLHADREDWSDWADA